jgi:hypothetical protein
VIPITLVLIAIGWGVFSWVIFRRFANLPALRRIAKRIHAHLLGIRLYSEELSLVWSAQKSLIADNLRLLRQLTIPAIILGVPFALIYPQLDNVYGRSPLVIGQSAVVTLQLSRDLTPADAFITIQTPLGIAIETPPILSFADRQIAWRIRAGAPAIGMLRIALPGSTVIAKAIRAGAPTLSWLRPRQSADDLNWLQIDYPKAEIMVAGLKLPWLAWFLMISTLTTISCVPMHARLRRFRHS